MGHNRIDDAKYKKEQWDKRYQDQLEKLRRDSQAKTQASIEQWQDSRSDHLKKYDEHFHHLEKIVSDRQRQFGMEGAGTLIRQFGPTLDAISKMSYEFEMYLFSVAGLALAENLNYNSSTPLMLSAEAARNIRAFFDYHLNTEGAFSEELQAMQIPYLADVDDQGLLTVNLDVPNTQLTEQDRQQFVGQHQADFDASIERWINEYEDPARPAVPEGPPNLMYQVEDIPGVGRKIRILPDPGVAEGDAAPRYMTKEGFRDFRTQALQPMLEQYFQAEFRPETPNNMQP